MTRAQEVLEAINNVEHEYHIFRGESYIDEKREVSPNKLATYLADLEARIEKIYDNCDCQL